MFAEPRTTGRQSSGTGVARVHKLSGPSDSAGASHEAHESKAARLRPPSVCSRKLNPVPQFGQLPSWGNFFLVALRGVYLKGVGLDILWPQMLAMAGLAVGLLSTAVWHSTRWAATRSASPTPVRKKTQIIHNRIPRQHRKRATTSANALPDRGPPTHSAEQCPAA